MGETRLHQHVHQGDYRSGSYGQTDSLQDFLQGFGFGFVAAILAGEALPLGRSTFLRQDGHVDELKGPHFVIEFASPSPNWRLFNDLNDVTFLWKGKEYRDICPMLFPINSQVWFYVLCQIMPLTTY